MLSFINFLSVVVYVALLAFWGGGQLFYDMEISNEDYKNNHI